MLVVLGYRHRVGGRRRWWWWWWWWWWWCGWVGRVGNGQLRCGWVGPRWKRTTEHRHTTPSATCDRKPERAAKNIPTASISLSLASVSRCPTSPTVAAVPPNDIATGRTSTNRTDRKWDAKRLANSSVESSVLSPLGVLGGMGWGGIGGDIASFKRKTDINHFLRKKKTMRTFLKKKKKKKMLKNC